MAIALSSGKLAFTAELLSLSNLKAELPKKDSNIFAWWLKAELQQPREGLVLRLRCSRLSNIDPKIYNQNKTKQKITKEIEGEKNLFAQRE